jgi:hypothetical protein
MLHEQFLPAGGANRSGTDESNAAPGGDGEHPIDPLPRTIHALKRADRNHFPEYYISLGTKSRRRVFLQRAVGWKFHPSDETSHIRRRP